MCSKNSLLQVHVSMLLPTPAGQRSSPSSLLLVLKRSLHLVKTPHARYSSSNPTNGRVLTSVSNIKSILSCSNTQLWIDNWKVKQRRLIFDRVVVLKTAAPPWDGGPRLHVVDVRNPGESKLQPGSREFPSLPPSFRARIPPSLGWVLMPTWGTGGEGKERKPSFSDSKSILSLSSRAESQPLYS